jgi:hypothetical protein
MQSFIMLKQVAYVEPRDLNPLLLFSAYELL